MSKVLPVASRLLVLVFGLLLMGAPPAAAQNATAKLGVVVSRTGEYEASYGKPFLDSVRLAVDEANASGVGPRIELEIQDDRSTEAGAREAATRVGESGAIVAVGPVLSILALPAGPAFAQAGIASIVSTAGSDLVTNNATTFQTVFRNSDLGESVADYLRHALGGGRAAVVFADNGYGQTIADGFRRGAERLGLQTTYHPFQERGGAGRGSAQDCRRSRQARRRAGRSGSRCSPIMMVCAAPASTAPVLGPGVLSDQSFFNLFRDQRRSAARRVTSRGTSSSPRR